MQYYDYDDMTRLPLEVINYISTYNIDAWVRSSSSKTGLHLMVDCPYNLDIFKKHSDTTYEARAEACGYKLLWDKGCSSWYKIKNFGVYEE